MEGEFSSLQALASQQAEQLTDLQQLFAELENEKVRRRLRRCEFTDWPGPERCLNGDDAFRAADIP